MDAVAAALQAQCHAISVDRTDLLLKLLQENDFSNQRFIYQGTETTLLHVAALFCSPNALKALVVWGADIDALDGKKRSARHIVATVSTANEEKRNQCLFNLAAAWAKRCSLFSVDEGCKNGCKEGEKYNGSRPANWPIEKDGTSLVNSYSYLADLGKRYQDLGDCSEDESIPSNNLGENLNPCNGDRLLCLDGGGVRGLILTQKLLVLEQLLQRITNKKKSVTSYFDAIAGTSTGGILGLAMANGLPIVECQKLYFKLKNNIFDGAPPYCSKKLEGLLRDVFGEQMMNTIKKQKIMVATSVMNCNPPDLYFVRNYLSADALEGRSLPYEKRPENTKIWQAAKLTSAAPGFFTLEDQDLVDGGLQANNPTVDALAEFSSFDSRPSVVVSLGTGRFRSEPLLATRLDPGHPNDAAESINSAKAVMKLTNVCVGVATQRDGPPVNRSRMWCRSLNIPFHRFESLMSKDVQLSETDDTAIVEMMFEARCYMIGCLHQSTDFLDQLLRPVRIIRPVPPSTSSNQNSEPSTGKSETSAPKKTRLD